MSERTQSMSEERAYMFDLNVRMLFLMERLTYGTAGDFTKDDMAAYLKQGLITEAASKHANWKRLPVTFGASQRMPMLHGPPAPLYYDREPDDPPIVEPCWPFDLVKVTLPEGWSLQPGCACGSNIDPSCFRVLKNGIVHATFSSFPDQAHLKTSSALDGLLNIVEGTSEGL